MWARQIGEHIPDRFVQVVYVMHTGHPSLISLRLSNLVSSESAAFTAPLVMKVLLDPPGNISTSWVRAHWVSVDTGRASPSGPWCPMIRSGGEE